MDNKVLVGDTGRASGEFLRSFSARTRNGLASEDELRPACGMARSGRRSNLEPAQKLSSCAAIVCLAFALCALCSCVPETTDDDARRPSVPLLRQPSSPSTSEFIRLVGYADPRNRITVYVNARRAATAVSDDDGRFEVPRLRLKQGENVITATATDWQGRKSRSTITGKRVKQDIRSETAPQVKVLYQE